MGHKFGQGRGQYNNRRLIDIIINKDGRILLLVYVLTLSRSLKLGVYGLERPYISL